MQGDWNSYDAGASDFNGTDAATSVIADSVTLLSNSWQDTNSYLFPYNMGWRLRYSQVWYRMAIIGGKGAAFPWINYTGAPTDFGTDGGAHNFLRFLENGDQPVNYMGATATFFYSRQAVGTYKCCTTVYGAPTRNFSFDANFNTPALLPPNTPVFRDMNAIEAFRRNCGQAGRHHRSSVGARSGRPCQPRPTAPRPDAPDRRRQHQQRAPLHVDLLRINPVNRPVFEQRVREDAVNVEHEGGCVCRVVEQLPVVVSGTGVGRYEVTTTNETR